MSRRAIGPSAALVLVLAACTRDGAPPIAGPVVPPPEPPIVVGPDPIGIASFATGVSHTCAIVDTGQTYCWGRGAEGQLGQDTTISTTTPTLTSTGNVKLAQLSVGNEHTCAVSTTAELYCWGLNNRGQLGTGDAQNRRRPTQIPVFRTARVRQVSAGGFHTCAVSTDNRGYCWGWNDDGQLGNGTRTGLVQAVEMAGDQQFLAISAGGLHSCGILSGTGRARCWGRGTSGQLGDGAAVSRLSPVDVAGSHAFASLSAGDQHTCGITLAGTASCWGAGTAGQLGNGTLADAAVPTAVSGGHTFISIAAGAEHTCGVTRTGELYCWGNNSFARVGQPGLATNYAVPTRVAVEAPDFISAGVGRLHSCALNQRRILYCFGFGGFGQLGNGWVTTLSTPTPVWIFPQ